MTDLFTPAVPMPTATLKTPAPKKDLAEQSETPETVLAETPSPVAETRVLSHSTEQEGSSSAADVSLDVEESMLQADLAEEESHKMRSAVTNIDAGNNSRNSSNDGFASPSPSQASSGLAGLAVLGDDQTLTPTVYTSGTTSSKTESKLAEFLKAENVAMKKALEDHPEEQDEDIVGGDDENAVVSPTKTRAVNAAVEASRKMANITSSLGSPLAVPSSASENADEDEDDEDDCIQGLTGRFTTDDTGESVKKVTMNLAKVNSSKSQAPTRGPTPPPTAKLIANDKSRNSRNSSSKFQSDYTIVNPSTKIRESMSTAEKLRAAEEEATRNSHGFVKISNATEEDDDYVPVADFTKSSAKKKKRDASARTIGDDIFDYADYAPELGSGNSIQKYRMMLRKKKRRRQKLIIRAVVVVLIVVLALMWWRNGSVEKDLNGASSISQEIDDQAGKDADIVSSISQKVDVQVVDESIPTTSHEIYDDSEIDSTVDEEDAQDILGLVEDQGTDMQIDGIGNDISEHKHDDSSIIDKEIVDQAEEDVKGDIDQEDEKDEADSDVQTTRKETHKEAEETNFVNAPKSNQKDLVVRRFEATKEFFANNVEARVVPFSHFFSKDVRSEAKSRPLLKNIDSFLDSMMQ